ncbi:DNA internalization-related competence protein ComEC/Rec2 [Mesobacillus subterraneus]|uniref:DNA internalization-related competence protein ComEC/Rec2 n=1 Tax=Mesobacillus subterraneus TaxID=285983 RepID=A0A3R9EXX0_9BACI|nr:DNA internalization-related competence protein ComEC/Rec2 [Mesobacillus subterraneus]RSD24143.1 DNA internalization-related competence protein ComEC/Rec2 [Mesobacillus subterraneus]
MRSGGNVSIRGKLIYFAAISVLALLSVFESNLLYGGLTFLAILFLSKQGKFRKSGLVILTACYLLFLFIGSKENEKLETHFNGTETQFFIYFHDEIKTDGDSLTATAKLLPAGEKVAIRHRIRTLKDSKSIETLVTPGAACKATGTLDIPPTARNPNAFDYKSYLQKNKITWIFNVDHIDLETCRKQTGSLIMKLKEFRQKEVAEIKAEFPPETAALAAALIFGERELFMPDTERDYQKIGIVHLLAISGLHVGLLAGMGYYILIRAGITRERTEVILLVLLPIYAVVTGLAPPVLRAAAMLMLIIGARRFNLRLTPLDAVSIAFILMTFYQPSIIYNIGFQLSFSVSFSLVLSSSRIFSAFTSLINQTAAASFIAQLASLPVILYSFYELSAISIFANLLFVPLFSLLLLPWLLVTYIFFAFMGFLPQMYFSILETVVDLVNTSASLLAGFPFSTIIIGKLHPMLLIIQIVLIPVFFLLWERSIVPKKKLPVWLMALPFIPLIIQLSLPYINPYGKIVFLDVGQGDSILIKMPFNQGNYLIDTGGVTSFGREDWQQRKTEYDPGKNIVVPFLKSEGIHTLDKLILTHGDADHIGGAKAVFKEINVKQLILPRIKERTQLEQEIVKNAVMEGTAVYFAGRGTGWQTNDGKFMTLNPASTTGDRNDQSIVLYAEFGGLKWLFTGDLGQAGERILVENVGGLDIDVLKVGHHGSKYSSSDLFIDQITPDYAVISVGERNRYGHPGEEVVNRLDERGTRIYRTDRQGAVMYKFKGKSGTFSHQIP